MAAAWMILIALLTASPASADSSTRIMWLKNNAPPFYFHAFHQDQPAFGDALQNMLQQKLRP